MRLAVVGVLCVCTLAFSAEPKWTTMRSEHFEMMTSAGAGASRDMLRNFEQIRSFFEGAFKFHQREDRPLRIVVFGSKKDYERYAFNSVAGAYYQSGYSHDAIVIGDMTYDVMPIAVHEYFHLVVRQSDIELPLWANEGMAELYSTLKPTGKQVLVGSLPPGRMNHLQMASWVSLDKILTADQDSGYYNEKNKASAYYSEAWALMHMLALSPDYRPKFSAVIEAITHGEDSIKAIERITGKSLREVDRDLQGYVRGSRFQGILFDIKLERDKSTIDEKPTPAYDQALALNDLLQKSSADVLAELERIIASDPQRNEGYVSRAYRAWHAGNNDAARKDFTLAFERGARNPRLLWDLARMAAHRDSKTAIAATEALIAQQGDRVEVRVLLSEIKLADGDAKGAYDALSALRKVTPKEAPGFFRAVTYASLKLKKWDEAKNAAEQLQRYATNDVDRNDAARALKFLAQRNNTSSADTEPADLITPRVVAGPELNGHRESDDYLSETGQWMDLDCPDTGAPTLILKTAAGAMKRFVIDKPNKMDISGKLKNGHLELTCGPQGSTPISIKYVPALSGADGLLRGIKFDQPTSAKP